MANYKKTVKANAVVNEETVDEKEDEVIIETPKKKFEQTDGVMCRSITNGLLNMIGQKTGIQYRWFDYGDETEVEYRDLVAEVRARNASVFDPRIIIEDDDFLDEYPQVRNYYTKEYNVQDLQQILAMSPDAMKAAILDLPKTVLPNLKNLVGTQITTGQLDSVKKIKILDELLDTDLNFLSELFQ